MAVSDSKRQGTCRLCFEEGGDLIAPCLCKGTSKWIHRECLDRWRSSTSNPRSLTNCCECGFQYTLKLERTVNSDAEARRRYFLRLLAAQGVGCFLVLQCVIIALGLIIRCIDSDEALVRFFHFPQHQGVDISKPGTFKEALQNHKMTYYVSGVLAFFFLVGLATTAWFCFYGCGECSGGGRHHRGYSRTGCICPACDCYDCYVMCSCCDHCRHDRYQHCPSIDMPRGSGGSDNPLLVLAVIVVVALIVIGILAAIVASITAIQKAVQQYAQLQSMRLLAHEYVVVDLAAPDDLGVDSGGQQNMEAGHASGPRYPVLSSEEKAKQDDLQCSISLDIGAIFDGPYVNRASGPSSTRYGSTMPA